MSGSVKRAEKRLGFTELKWMDGNRSLIKWAFRVTWFFTLLLELVVIRI